MIVSGKVWVFGDDINSDLIMPASLTFSGETPGDEPCRRGVMCAIRPGWGALAAAGDIIIAGRNFGCGSGRPAAGLLRRIGICAVAADSLARQFFRNAIHCGLPAISAPGVRAAFDEGETAELDINAGVVRNKTRGTEIAGSALPAGSPPFQILLAGGVDAYLRALLDSGGLGND